MTKISLFIIVFLSQFLAMVLASNLPSFWQIYTVCRVMDGGGLIPDSKTCHEEKIGFWGVFE